MIRSRSDRLDEIVKSAEINGVEVTAKHYGLQEDTVRRYQRLQNETDDVIKLVREIFSDPPQKWNQYPKLYGDWVSTADWHIPFFNQALLEKVIKVSELLKIPNLLIIGDFADTFDVIFDPFMGSGSVPLACEKAGHKWIACEINEDYCTKAVERIKQEVAQLKMAI